MIFAGAMEKGLYPLPLLDSFSVGRIGANPPSGQWSRPEVFLHDSLRINSDGVTVRYGFSGACRREWGLADVHNSESPIAK